MALWRRKKLASLSCYRKRRKEKRLSGGDSPSEMKVAKMSKCRNGEEKRQQPTSRRKRGRNGNNEENGEIMA
jgi:hypothetical protein